MKKYMYLYALILSAYAHQLQSAARRPLRSVSFIETNSPSSSPEPQRSRSPSPKPFCSCPDYHNELSQDPEEALDQVLAYNIPHTPLEQRKLFDKLQATQFPVEYWPSVYTRSRTLLQHKEYEKKEFHPACALQELLNPQHEKNPKQWPVIHSFIALCLSRIEPAPDDAFRPDIQGPYTYDTACTLAASHNDHLLAQYALNRNNYPHVSLSMFNHARMTPLALAPTKTLVQLFAKGRLPKKWKRQTTQETLLHMSMLASHCACTTKEYLNLGVDPNATNCYEETALHYLVRECFSYTIAQRPQLLRKAELLCNSRLDISAKNNRKETATQALEKQIKYLQSKIDNGHVLHIDEVDGLENTHILYNKLREEAGWRRSSQGRTSRRYSIPDVDII